MYRGDKQVLSYIDPPKYGVTTLGGFIGTGPLWYRRLTISIAGHDTRLNKHRFIILEFRYKITKDIYLGNVNWRQNISMVFHLKQ